MSPIQLGANASASGVTIAARQENPLTLAGDALPAKER